MYRHQSTVIQSIKKQSGSNGEGGEGDERTQLTGGDGDPQPHHLLCSPTGTSLIGTRHSSGVTTLLLSTLLTIAAGFFFVPYDRVYVSCRTLKHDIFVWFLM